jgi:hypothetical protein
LENLAALTTGHELTCSKRSGPAVLLCLKGCAMKAPRCIFGHREKAASAGK